MKRYLIFCGEEFYPSGGMADYITSSDTYASAIEIIAIHNTDSTGWWHIYDSNTHRIVAASNCAHIRFSDGIVFEQIHNTES